MDAELPQVLNIDANLEVILEPKCLITARPGGPVDSFCASNLGALRASIGLSEAEAKGAKAGKQNN